MKGRIPLGDFIAQVKGELQNAQSNPVDAFYELTDVQLEVTFVLSAKGGAKGKLVVVELGGETTASQTHKVVLKLKPLPRKEVRENSGEDDNGEKSGSEKSSKGGGGGASLRQMECLQPLYAPAPKNEDLL